VKSVFLAEKDRETLKSFLTSNLVHPVTLRFFTQEVECETCRGVRTLLEEVVTLSPLLHLSMHNFLLGKEIALSFHIDKIPVFTVEGERDYGIRFFGTPSGYEFFTPTCPFCPQAVVLGHKMALGGERVTSSMVEVVEFPYLAYRYGVRAVPKIVINDAVGVEGAIPEDFLVQKVVEVLV
jgi:alkyl hydroperoxide reductase subunit AhpF